MISIDAMALFTEKCKTEDKSKVVKWFKRNVNDFDKEELINIATQLLYAVAVDCNDPEEVLGNIGIELDEQYEEAYQKKVFNVTFKESTYKTIQIVARDMDEAQVKANEMLDDVVENIDFEKDFDSWDVGVDEIKEVK